MVSFLKIKSLAAERQLDMCVCMYIYTQQLEITSMRHGGMFQSVQYLGCFFPRRNISLLRAKIIF